ncbi:hypothetical protein Bbelb_437770 [Branchiostoma belcheri]|nr:hypothetical protein Bbelb_437770 [Branchiostoma belcheri]
MSQFTRSVTLHANRARLGFGKRRQTDSAPCVSGRSRAAEGRPPPSGEPGKVNIYNNAVTFTLQLFDFKQTPNQRITSVAERSPDVYGLAGLPMGGAKVQQHASVVPLPRLV